MNQLATITSKKQLTLPSKIFKQAGFKIGQKVTVWEKNGNIIITSSKNLVEDLAGSLTTPKKWQNKSTKQIIQKAKKEYFQKIK